MNEALLVTMRPQPTGARLATLAQLVVAGPRSAAAQAYLSMWRVAEEAVAATGIPPALVVRGYVSAAASAAEVAEARIVAVCGEDEQVNAQPPALAVG